MMAHNRSLSRMQSKSEAGGAGMGERRDPLAQPGGEESMGESSPEQVAQEHGPAVEVNVMHNHEAGEHHVHSKHPDGHEHHSDHASAGDAHDHAKMLAMGGQDESGMGGDEEEPSYE
jgi:hypothetical protein